MRKCLYFAVFYFIIGLTFAHPGSNFFSFLGFGRPRPNLYPTSICSDPTTAQSYLTRTLAIINNFENDSSINAILQQQSANFVSYLKNTTNQALLSTNCPLFVTNLKAAKIKDKAAVRVQQQMAFNIEQQFQQVIANVTGSYGRNELDIDAPRGPRF